MTLLEVHDLKTHFHTEDGLARAVDGVSFSMEEGESLALVGESACGKSVTALSILGLVRPPGFHAGGRIVFEDTELTGAREDVLRGMRGNRISMIFQEPMTSLNPVFTVGNQLAEPLVLHRGMRTREARRHCAELLEQLGFADPLAVLGSYPHQLSGGMRQRVMIAMAIACRPRLMIADEPSTALDVTVQAQILHLIRQLQQEYGMALLLITHDLGVVNQMCDRICVMYSGRVAEIGPRERVLEEAAHPYTVKLLESIPRGVGRAGELSVIRGQVRSASDYPEGCRFAERCDLATERCTASDPSLYDVPGDSGHLSACFLQHPEQPLERRPPPPVEPVAIQGSDESVGDVSPVPARGEVLLETRRLTTHFPVRKGFFRRIAGYVRAVDGVSLAIREGATLGLVGESGCGKTTLGHSLLNLEGAARGEVRFEGDDLLAMPAGDLRRMRRKVQIIFQDPFASLNPRLTVNEIVGEGLRVHEPGQNQAQVEARIAETLDEVGLDPELGHRYPHEFSGGQRQRIAVARALVLRPRFIVLDEATSALDVSVQAQILNLLRTLQVRHGLTYLFITHDLGVVDYLADHVAVMYLGRIVEYGPAEDVFRAPRHPYTRSLLDAVPTLERRWSAPPALTGDVPSPVNPPSGCHFHPRCPLFAESRDESGSPAGGSSLAEACPARYPEAVDVQGEHWAACHGVTAA